MSKINIEGIVRDIKGRTTYLTPLIEAICNSIDAIGGKSDGLIEIIVKRDNQKSTDDVDKNRGIGSIISIDVKDNGKGFDENNRESFDTYKSGYKYHIGGKGFGRFMYLKYFNKVTIESIYKENDVFKKRSFTFGHGAEIIEDEKVEDYTEKNATTGTVLHLSSVKQRAISDKGLEVIARKLVEKLLVFFVDKTLPTILLKEVDDSNTIVLNNYIRKGGDIELLGEEPLKLKSPRTGNAFDFTVNIYKIYYSDITSRISLTANYREVTDSPIHNYIPEFKETLFEVNGKGQQKNYTVTACVIGNYLDDNVSMERDTFTFSNSKENDMFVELSQPEIEKEAANIAKMYFQQSMDDRFEEKKKKIIDYVNGVAPWNKSLLGEIDMTSLPVGVSDEELEMTFQKAKFNKEQKTRIALKEILNNQEEDRDSNDSIEDQVNEILQVVSETGKNDLAHYVCTRKKVLDLFDNLRKRTESGRAHLECEVHNLIFPMVSNDRQTEYNNHNLWLLDERLVFTQYIASDKVISHVEHEEPDLAIFFKERMFYRNGDNIITSPVTIFEFKRPKRTNYPDDENPITQACRYAKKILEGKYEMPEGIEPVKVDKHHTPVYIYIVCDIVPKINEFADNASLTLSPDGEGYFGYIKAYNAYVEIMSFRKLVDDAKMRNKIFFKKLGIE